MIFYVHFLCTFFIKSKQSRFRIRSEKYLGGLFMKAKKLLAIFMSVCMLISAVPAATLITATAVASSAAYDIVECKDVSPSDPAYGGINAKETINGNSSRGVAIETSNISTTNGSVAVYDINFDTVKNGAMQIYYSGRSTGYRCPMSANANIYLGDYWNDYDNCTLLGNVKLVPYGDNWATLNLSTICELPAGLSGTQKLSVEYIGEEGYTNVANARQMFFYEEAMTDLTPYVDADTATAISGSNSKTGDANEGPAFLFDGNVNSKLGINRSGMTNVVISYTTKVPTTLKAYTLFTANDSDNRDPVSWVLKGSNDGEDYTLIDTVDDFDVTTDRRTWYGQIFTVDSEAEYKYFQLEITKHRASEENNLYCQFSRLCLYGSLNNIAADVEAVENLITAIYDTVPLTKEYFSAVSSAQSAYAALSAEGKSYVTNYSDLAIPAAVCDANNTLGATDAEYVYNLITEIQGYMPITYKSKNDIASIIALYADAVAENGQDYVERYIPNYTDARDAQTTYNAIIDTYRAFTFTVDRDNMYTDNQQWLALQTDEEWKLTTDAMTDTVVYFISERMINIGVNPNTGTKKTENYQNVLGVQLDSHAGKGYPNDNCGNPWGQDNRYWSYLIVPFTGMAFDIGGYMVNSLIRAPLGEEFEVSSETNTYQVLWDGTAVYSTVPREHDKIIPVGIIPMYPGSGDYADIIGNVFRYSYADYSQTNKWDGKTLGYPVDNAQFLGTHTYYQEFKSNDGTAILLSVGSVLDDVTLDVDAEGYQAQLKETAEKTFVITGEMAEIIESMGGAHDFFDIAGDLDFSASTADLLVFEGGTLSVGGFTNVSDDSLREIAAPVIDLINEIGNVSLKPSVNSLAKITAAENAYNNIIFNARFFVTNYSVLIDAKAAYDALLDEIAAYDSAKYITVVSGANPGSDEGCEKLFDGDSMTKLYMEDSFYQDTIITTATPVKLVGYSMVTGNDTTYADGGIGSRNPVAWKIYGSNDGITWNEVVASSETDVLPYENLAEAAFYLENPSDDAYSSFKIEFTRQSENDGKFQLSEMTFLTAREANYDGVIAALKDVPADLSIYTDDTRPALEDALNNITYNLAPSAQATVDGYADAINNAVAGLAVKYADYTAVDEAIAKFAALVEDNYTAESWSAAQTAYSAVTVVRGKVFTEQAVVDGYAKALNAAYALLETKIDGSIQLTITEGMVAASSDLGKENRFNITWNAEILINNDMLSLDDINASGIKFKSYGVFYASSEEALADIENLDSVNARKLAVNSGDDIVVYTRFGFRLKNVTAEKARSAMFYLEYELDGTTYVVVSSIDTVVANIALD